MSIPAILIFDVGKTNKKIVLFDEQYKVLFEESTIFDETKDEDGFACEDIRLLTEWINLKFKEILLRKDITIKAVNFSAYGASFVNLDAALKPCTPLYNYLKPFPQRLKQQFYETYGDENLIAKQTASPVLGSLNSGMQLYRLKYEKPEVYKMIQYCLHLPQYLSFIISEKVATDITSIGCHTSLWDFTKNSYHDWVYKEGFNRKFAPLTNSDAITIIDNNIKAGVGLHDSSAALIPYLISFNEPFILLSTGTWNISLNPFNYSPLTDKELKQDCLCYLSYKGTPVKASRLFGGYKHEEQTKRIAEYFHKDFNYYKTIVFDPELMEEKKIKTDPAIVISTDFSNRDISSFENYENAYHELMAEIIRQQFCSTSIVLNGSNVKKIFVDGGFSSNDIYMQLLATAFPQVKVYAAENPQASALGAALCIHKAWNKVEVPSDIVKLIYY